MALDAILARKRADLAAGPPRSTEPVEPSDRSFLAALTGRRPALILEIKPASPSEGAIRADRDLAPFIGAAGRHADAISVLTEQAHFGGSMDLLRRVRASVPQPILCKDFFLDPEQIREARRAGADAVLLMLSVLDDDGYRACAAEAGSFGMGVLTEVHSREELDRAIALGAPVIGVNARDLRTLAIDLAGAAELIAAVPADRVTIAESGIRSRADLRVAVAAGADGCLIGTALMKAAAPDFAARALIYGCTKVCGLTRAEDAAAAARLGATHGGLVFAEESPRRIDPLAATAIREAAALAFVGVFVNERPERIAEIATRLDLAAVQLHGDEDQADVIALRRLLGDGREIWKAVPVADRLPPIPAAVDRILLDGAGPGARGGTGRPFDWSLLRAVDGGLERLILAGGLNAERMAAAIQTGIDFFDLSSGVESAPGIKSVALMAELFGARRRGRGDRR